MKLQHPTIDRYLDNPKVALGLSASDAAAVTTLASWAGNVATDLMWARSETARHMESETQRLASRRDVARKAIRDGSKLSYDIETAYGQATSQIQGVLKMDPMQVFNAARSGKSVDFRDSAGIESYVPKLGELGTRAQYTEDDTLGLNYDVSGVSGFVDQDKTGTELLNKSRYVAPPTPAAGKEIQAPSKGAPVERTPSEPSTTDTYRVTLRDGTVETVTVPKGQDPRKVAGQRSGDFAGGGGVGYEKVTPLQDLGEAVSRGWDATKEFFSRPPTGGESGASQEAPKPKARTVSSKERRDEP